MQYGNGPLNKYEYACSVAASLAYLVLKQQDAIGCTSFDESIRQTVQTRSKRTHLQAIIESLNVAEPQDKTEMYSVLRSVAEAQPRRGMMILISDLLGDSDGLIRGLRLLRQRGHDVLVLQIMDDDELDFNFSGPTRFEGLETLDALNCNPRALREGYLESLNEFLSETRRKCAGHGIDYSLVRTSEPLGTALTKFLSTRMARQR